MPTVAFTKFQQFPEDLAHGVHNLSTDTFKVWLSNTVPAATHETLSQITEISYTNCSSRTLTVSASAQTSGVYKWDITDITLTASGGTVGPFRYIGIYNDTPTSPADPLVCYYDYGSSITIDNGGSLDIDFDGTNGVLTVT